MNGHTSLSNWLLDAQTALGDMEHAIEDLRPRVKEKRLHSLKRDLDALAMHLHKARTKTGEILQKAAEEARRASLQ